MTALLARTLGLFMLLLALALGVSLIAPAAVNAAPALVGLADDDGSDDDTDDTDDTGDDTDDDSYDGAAPIEGVDTGGGALARPSR